MARKKVKLEWIVNDSSRRATFKKRRKGMIKKASELSTLCDVKACLVIYGPNESQPEVWPSMSDAMRVFARFKKMPEMEQSKKMMNQEGFMQQRIMKLQEQLRKQDRENREQEATLLMHQGLAGRSLHTLTIEDITSLALLIEIKINKVRERLEYLNGEMALKMEGPPNAKEKTPLEAAMEELQRQEWFMETINPHDLVAKEEMALKMAEKAKELEKQKMEGPSNAKEKTPLEAAMEELQRQEWFMETINPHDLLAKEEMALKMADKAKEEKQKMEGPSNAKEKAPLGTSMEELQRQEWFTETMNQHDLVVCGNKVTQPYIDPNNPWLDAYFR